MKLTRPQLLVCAAACVLLVVAVATPGLLGHPVMRAAHALTGASPWWLSAAGLTFLGAFGATVVSWRAALRAAGAQISYQRTAAALGVGSLVNSFAPAKLGDAVKVALCARAIDEPGRLWTAGGVYAGLGAARTLGLAALVVAGASTGALPLWPVFALCGAVAVLAVAATRSSRIRGHERIRAFSAGFAALQHSPRTAVTVVGFTLLMVSARLTATVCVAAALGLPHPVLAALVILPAIDLAGVLPLTPGNLGVGTGAVALALASRGIGTTQALGVGLALQGVETLVSISVGTFGALSLARPGAALRRWSLRLGYALGVAAVAASVGGAVFFAVVKV